MNRSQWIEVVERTASVEPAEAEAEWIWLLAELRLPAEAFIAVLEVVKQGRWKEAGNPKAYLRTAARREFRKMEEKTAGLGPLSLLDGPAKGEGFSMGETLDVIGHVAGSSQAIKSGDGVWRRGSGRGDGYDYDGEDDSHNQKTYRDRLIQNISVDLKSIVEPSEELRASLEELNQHLVDNHIHATPWTEVDWERWADRAGFDRYEKEALRCRLQGMSRERAMDQQPDDASRRAIQAAWRKFDRSGQRRLRTAAGKMSAPDVPE